MKNHITTNGFNLIMILIAMWVFYYITFGIEHRRFEQHFGMAYPITKEYKENAKMNVLLKLIKERREMLAMYAKINEYRIQIRTMPLETGEEKIRQQKFLEMCDYFETVILKDEEVKLRESCKSAFQIGMENELVKYGFIEPQS